MVGAPWQQPRTSCCDGMVILSKPIWASHTAGHAIVAFQRNQVESRIGALGRLRVRSVRCTCRGLAKASDSHNGEHGRTRRARFRCDFLNMPIEASRLFAVSIHVRSRARLLCSRHDLRSRWTHDNASRRIHDLSCLSPRMPHDCSGVLGMSYARVWGLYASRDVEYVRSVRTLSLSRLRYSSYVRDVFPTLRDLSSFDQSRRRCRVFFLTVMSRK